MTPPTTSRSQRSGRPPRDPAAARGRSGIGGGGAVLARPAAEIRLGQIIRLLEESQPLVECFGADGGACSIDARCGLKARLRSAEAAFLADLDRSTLADWVGRAAFELRPVHDALMADLKRSTKC